MKYMKQKLFFHSNLKYPLPHDHFLYMKMSIQICWLEISIQIRIIFFNSDLFFEHGTNLGIIIVFFIRYSHSVNYIMNGEFQLPVIQPTQCLNTCPSYWNCTETQLSGPSYQTSKLFGQYADMQYNLNGILSQNVILPQGIYNLSFYHSSYGNNYPVSLQVWWNNVVISTILTPIQGPNFKNFTVTAINGTNYLKFQQNGTNCGTLIDNVPLSFPLEQKQDQKQKQEQKQTDLIFPQSVASSISFALSLPATSLPTFHNLYLILTDISLYCYDIKDYQGIVKQIFDTISYIDQLKMQILKKWFKFENNMIKLLISNYTNFTDGKFVQIQGSSSVFIQSCLDFFLFNVPQGIIVPLLLYGLFLIIRNYQISRNIRIYYFTKSIFLQYVLQQNIAYFVFVCFSHLHISFTFQIYDKLSLIFTVIYLFCIVIYSCTFYYLLGHYLNHSTYHFHLGIYRCFSSYTYMTVKTLIRAFLRGVIFFNLHNRYQTQIIILGILELFTSLFILFMDKKYAVFMTKILLCRHFSYHLLIAMLNFSFYVQYICQIDSLPQIQEYVLDFQQILIYLIIGLSLLGIIFDLLPLQWFFKNYEAEMENFFNQLQFTNKKKTKASLKEEKQKGKCKIKGENQCNSQNFKKTSMKPCNSQKYRRGQKIETEEDPNRKDKNEINNEAISKSNKFIKSKKNIKILKSRI